MYVSKKGERLLRIHLHAFEMQEVQEATGLGEGEQNNSVGV